MMHVSLRKKEFWGLIFPPLAGLGVLIFIFFYLLLPSFEASLVAQKKQTIRELTRSASHILEYYENKRQKGELSRDEAQHKAMEEIRALRYGPENRDYFWINDLRPVMVMHPYRPDLEGKNVAGLKDSHGVLLIMKFIEATRETGSGYVPYYWQWKDDPTRIVPKLSYVQRFPPWQWIIGTGIYLEDVRKEIALITRQLTILFVLIFAVVVLGSGYAVRQGLREAKRKRLAEESSALYLRELKENEERYQELFDHLGDGVFVYQGVDEGQDFVFVDMNKTGETVVQTQREEVVGRRVTQVFPAVERMGLLDVLRRVWRTGQPEHHPFTEYADGRITLWAENYIYKLPSGLIVAIYSDTTEKRRADEALRESEEKYRTLVENIPQKIFTKDKRLIYLSCNENFARDQGVTPEELTGKTDYDFFPKELADKYRFDDMRIMASGKTEGIEEQYVLNGEKVWVYTVKTPIRDSEGNTAGILGVFSDITERKQLRERLEKSENRLKTIIDTEPECIKLLAADGALLEMNAAGLAMIEADSLDQVKDQCVYPLVEPKYREQFKQLNKDVFAGKAGILEFELIGLKGAHRWMETHAVPFRDTDGKIIAQLAVTHDVTTRKRAEQTLVARRRELEVLHRVSEIALREHALHSTLQEIVQEISATIGFPIVEIEYYEETQQEMEFVAATGIPLPPDGARRKVPVVQTLSGAVARSGQPLVETHAMDRPEYAFEALRSLKVQTFVCVPMLAGTRVIGTLSLASPETVQLDEHIVPLADSLANLIATIIERMRAEEEKEKLQAQLQQAQKMESVGRLAGGVAHDFNNMLGVILGHAEMALLRVDPAQPIHADLTEILKAGKRSVDLTRQLLAFARRQAVAPEVLDLNETVAGMLKMLQRLIGEDIHLHWQPETNLWPVRVDPSQIDQILANLCVNARDAIAGVGRLSIETKNSIFDEEYCAGHSGFAPGEYVRLAVTDDGCGMDQETLSHLFEPFFTTKEVGEGTGLGLATVYGIVKQNNGFVNVYSEPGKGTTFTVYLPRHAGKVEQARRPEGTAEPVLRGHETILLVEDESAILEMTTMMLEMQGYTVLAASTPGEAIRLAGEHAGEIHLLITDVVMPEMNGRDLAKNLLSLYPHLKCLFMSGYTADVIAHHGVLDEGVSFIQKPFSRQDLAAKVRKVLEGA